MKLVKLASVTKKITIAAVGAFLLVFLPMHMGLNLCIIRDDGGEWYRNVCHFMGTNWIVKIFELVLLACCLLHIVVGVLLTIENYMARPVRYQVPSRTKTHFGSKYMIWTGGLVFCFLVLHFINFYFVKYDLVEGVYTVKTEKLQMHIQDRAMDLQKSFDEGKMSQEELSEKMMGLQMEYLSFFQLMQTGQPADKLSRDGQEIVNLDKKSLEAFAGKDFKDYEPDFYTMCNNLFKDRTYSLIYILALIVLGIHLFHAVNSIFQTFGLNHRKYNGAIEMFATIYAILIPVGFAVVPFYVMFVR